MMKWSVGGECISLRVEWKFRTFGYNLVCYMLQIRGPERAVSDASPPRVAFDVQKIATFILTSHHHLRQILIIFSTTYAYISPVQPLVVFEEDQKFLNNAKG